MSYTVTKYPTGTFSYTDFASTDAPASSKFMTALLGWTVQEMPMGEDSQASGPYYSFFLDGKAVAGGMQMPEEMKKQGVPSMWNSYVTVENVDEALKKAIELGGKVAMPAMDVFDVCRMAAVMDPTGAVIMLYHPKKVIGAEIVNTPGAMSWNELYTKDLDKAKDFYSKLFGWTFEADEKTGYVMIKNNGRMNGGMMKMDEQMEKSGMPSKWMTYFTVKNIDEAVAKVKELGGQVYMQKDLSVGKIAIVADPAQAGFVLMQMSVTPDEWVE